ncbi:aspartyl-phosphate phosphatase Spo0E family protein [Paenibacillus pinistramenti]|uniref:aspartyl-phosphate phosphatase Spo0E family protein n=1 Tax=Paenibacillus pinistramenti TaxID=1768003 RepID=UPI00110940D5
MSCGEYNLPNYIGSMLAENSSNNWMFENQSISTPARKLSLEDEIRLLRSRMEKIFMEEQSFTSDIVVEISTLLDLKINEYMKARSGQWNQ